METNTICKGRIRDGSNDSREGGENVCVESERERENVCAWVNEREEEEKVCCT
jgi:hypothetical protein